MQTNFKKKLYSNFLFICITVILLFFFSCGPESSSSEKPVIDEYLTSSNLVAEKTKEDVISLVNLVKLGGINIDSKEIKQDLKIYKIEYKTKYKGELKIASALVYVPVASDDSPDSYSLLVYNHGTIANNAGAPTEIDVDAINNGIPYAMSATGIVAVVPDYLGYGSSKDITHPYFIADVTAATIRDSISAAYEMLRQKSIKINGNLYTTGYSEGGYVTMTLHRSLEENPLEPFNFKASFPAAGGYDIISFRDHVVKLTTYDQPFFLAFVAKAYKTYYDFEDKFYSQFIKAPFDSKIDSLIDGENDSDTINQGLTNKIAEILTPSFISNPDSIQNLKEKMTLNSPINFIPKVKMIMYHGKDDITVPYNNSIVVKDKFLNTGASSDVVIFKEISGNHTSAISSYINNIFEEILKLED